MESFWRRLKYYGVGFTIGLIFVIFFFKNRGCSWLPENRVKNSILDRVVVLPDSQLDEMKRLKLTKEELAMVLNDGEVDFDKSVKKKNPKIYTIEKTIHGKKINFYYTLLGESFLTEIHFKEKSAEQVKIQKEGMGELISFPNDEDLVCPDSVDRVTCQQNFLKLINPRDILKLLKKNGRMDFSRSHLNVKPKPEHYLVFTDNKGREIGCETIWYKNKLYINNFLTPFDTGCK